MGVRRLPQDPLEQRQQLLLAPLLGGGEVAVDHIRAIAEHPGQQLRAPEVHADRRWRAQDGNTVGRGIREAIRQYYRLMAAGDDERRDPPEYNVYRAGSGRGRKGGDRDPKDKRPAGGRKRSDDEPEYSVYRASRNPFARLREADLGAIRGKLGDRRKADRRRRAASRARSPVGAGFCGSC